MYLSYRLHLLHHLLHLSCCLIIDLRFCLITAYDTNVGYIDFWCTLPSGHRLVSIIIQSTSFMLADRFFHHYHWRSLMGPSLVYYVLPSAPRLVGIIIDSTLCWQHCASFFVFFPLHLHVWYECRVHRFSMYLYVLVRDTTSIMLSARILSNIIIESTLCWPYRFAVWWPICV